MQPMVAVLPSLPQRNEIRGARQKRGLQIFVVSRVAVPISLFAVFVIALGISCSAGGLDELDTQTLEQWLRLAYVETEDRAGFGDFPIELIEKPTLYTTSGAIPILSFLDVPIQDSETVVAWIGSLRTEAGFYDDPSEGAPCLIETLWALSALRGLDALPADSQVITFALIALLESDGLVSPAVEQELTLMQRMHDAWQIIRCLGELGVLSSDSVHAMLLPTLDRCLRLFIEMNEEFAACEPWALDETHDLLWTATRIICAISPTRLPEAGVALLNEQLVAIEIVPTDFIGSIHISELLDAAGSYYGWSAIPKGVALAVRDYLVNQVLPTLEPFGVFGWTRTWGTWLDPQMNIQYVALYARIGETHPYASRIVDTFDVARIDSGWVRMAMAVPHPDFTYFGLTLSRAIEASFCCEERISHSASITLMDPESDLQDLLYAVRTLKALQRFSAEEKETVSSRINWMWESQLADEAYWLVRLVLESGIVPNGPVSRVLQDRAQQNVSAISENQVMLMLREMAWLFSILGDELLEPEVIAEAVLALQSPQGGFLSRADAPYPDLFSTLCAVETLEELGGLSCVSPSQCLGWVDQCYSSPGYLPGSPLDVPADEQGYVDLYSTYMAVRVMEILATSGS